MKDLRTETQKLVHNFITLTVIFASFILIAMGIFAAKNNNDALNSGIQPAMIYAARDDMQISVTVDKSVYTAEKLEGFSVDTALSLAPAPIGSLYLLAKNIIEYATL